MLSKKATYIVGRAGSGKSELIKSIWHSMKKGSVILDPHGDLADEIALFDGVAMIAPHRQRFVINPFDIQDKSEENRALVAQEITDMLVEMIRDIGISSLMETISFPIRGSTPKPSEFPADLYQSVASQSIPAKTASKSIGLRLSLKA